MDANRKDTTPGYGYVRNVGDRLVPSTDVQESEDGTLSISFADGYSHVYPLGRLGAIRRVEDGSLTWKAVTDREGSARRLRAEPGAVIAQLLKETGPKRARELRLELANLNLVELEDEQKWGALQVALRAHPELRIDRGRYAWREAPINQEHSLTEITEALVDRQGAATSNQRLGELRKLAVQARGDNVTVTIARLLDPDRRNESIEWQNVDPAQVPAAAQSALIGRAAAESEHEFLMRAAAMGRTSTARKQALNDLKGFSDNRNAAAFNQEVGRWSGLLVPLTLSPKEAKAVTQRIIALPRWLLVPGVEMTPETAATLVRLAVALTGTGSSRARDSVVSVLRGLAADAFGGALDRLSDSDLASMAATLSTNVVVDDAYVWWLSAVVKHGRTAAIGEPAVWTGRSLRDFRMLLEIEPGLASALDERVLDQVIKPLVDRACDSGDEKLLQELLGASGAVLDTIQPSRLVLGLKALAGKSSALGLLVAAALEQVAQEGADHERQRIGQREEDLQRALDSARRSQDVYIQRAVEADDRLRGHLTESRAALAADLRQAGIDSLRMVVDVLEEVRVSADQGTPDLAGLLRRARQAATTRGLVVVGEAGDVVAYDPAVHELPEAGATSRVELITPAYVLREAGGTVTLTRSRARPAST